MPVMARKVMSWMAVWDKEDAKEPRKKMARPVS
jgi:hypothetical protein